MSSQIEAVSETGLDALTAVVLEGLSRPQKALPAWLFYDERGSQFFEQITSLPEYYLTRTERSILARHAPALPAHLGAKVTVAELGAGSAAKTGLLLKEFVAHQGSTLYQPIDISPTALEEAATSLADKVPGVDVESQVANYITDPYTLRRPQDHAILALYIGSSIGNFPPDEARAILSTLRGHLELGDSLLLGVDLAPGRRKSIDILLAAYDDAAGVTAAFNKNMLMRLNRETGANFDTDAFAHRAQWNAEASRIEMHLESLQAQTVQIGGESISFVRGETIHTENSHKFRENDILSLLRSSGFEIDQMMHDDDERFAVVLANTAQLENVDSAQVSLSSRHSE